MLFCENDVRGSLVVMVSLNGLKGRSLVD
jgi:hypothetical protein